MSMHRTPRTGLVLCAIALLVAGCSGSGGSDGNATSPVPRGLGGPGNHNAHHHKQHGGKSNKPGKHHHKGNGPTSSTSPAHHPGHSSAPPQGHSSQPGQHSSSAASGGGGSHTSTAPAHHPPAGPRVTVTPNTGLGSVQTVTVEGFGFKPNTLLAVAECHDRGLDTGLPDCNINNVITYSPGAKVRSDGNGHVGPLQITVRKTFKSVDCGSVKCLVAVSEPSLRPDTSDEGDHYIHFQ
jgi:Neocarzinostatin family